MYENYKNLHPINTSVLQVGAEKTYSTGPFTCYNPVGGVYWAGCFEQLVPLWYTGWRDEGLSYHLTASFHAHLNASPVTVIRGPEAKKFMSENFVNNVENFPIGIIKHGIMTVENGQIATHGIIMRTGEEEYECWWHAPYINYAFRLKDYDAELIDNTNKVFLFQTQGPAILDILEEVTGEDLRDIDYRHFRDSTINGHKVRILRFGMGGTLAYEIHGETQHAQEIAKKILEIGNPYGIRQMGVHSYSLNHVEGGFPNILNHFMTASFIDPGFQKFTMGGKSEEQTSYDVPIEFCGSAGPDPMKRLFNPFEIGLGHCINWNHEFRGKKALQEYAKNKKRGIVTLEWNVEDLTELYASQFRKGEEPYFQMDYAGDPKSIYGRFMLSSDLVFNADGKEIGISMGRTNSAYFQAMLSLATLDLEYHQLDTEVYILWGDVGSRQMKIRAKVAPFPYNQEAEILHQDKKV